MLRQGAGADLPGDRRGMVQRVVEALGRDVQASVRGTRIGGAEGVELLDRAIGVDHDDGARQESQSFDRAWLAEHELDEFAEQADPGLLLGSGVPAFEDADQPVCIIDARRRATPVGVRQQQVNRGRVELQQRLIGGNGVVASIDRAQYAAVALTELR